MSVQLIKIKSKKTPKRTQLNEKASETQSKNKIIINKWTERKGEETTT